MTPVKYGRDIIILKNWENKGTEEIEYPAPLIELVSRGAILKYEHRITDGKYLVSFRCQYILFLIEYCQRISPITIKRVHALL